MEIERNEDPRQRNNIQSQEGLMEQQNLRGREGSEWQRRIRVAIEVMVEKAKELSWFTIDRHAVFHIGVQGGIAHLESLLLPLENSHYVYVCIVITSLWTQWSWFKTHWSVGKNSDKFKTGIVITAPLCQSIGRSIDIKCQAFIIQHVYMKKTCSMMWVLNMKSKAWSTFPTCINSTECWCTFLKVRLQMLLIFALHSWQCYSISRSTDAFHWYKCVKAGIDFHRHVQGRENQVQYTQMHIPTNTRYLRL